MGVDASTQHWFQGRLQRCSEMADKRAQDARLWAGRGLMGAVVSWQVSGPVFSMRCREGQDGMEGCVTESTSEVLEEVTGRGS